MPNRIHDHLQKLRMLEADLLKDEKLPSYDLSKQEDKERLSDFVSDIFSERLRRFRENKSISDSDELILRRRKQAVVSLAAEAEERFGKEHPALCVAEEYARISAPCSMLTFDTLNAEYDIEMAAALWMLDYLDSHGLYEEAAAAFPQSDAQLNSVYLPSVSDSTHSDDAVRAMKYLIRSRNRGLNGYNENKAFIDVSETGLRENTSAEPPADRQRFDSVMELIDKDDREALKREFISYINSFTGYILKLVETYRTRLLKSKEALLKEVRSQIKRYESAYTAAPDNGIVFTEATVSGSDRTALPQMNEESERLNSLIYAAADAEGDLDRVYQFMLLYPVAGTGKIKEFDAEKVVEGFEGLSITDPYEMCFAFLLLLDENSDHVWAYNICYDVLSYACQSLPWAGFNVVDPDGTKDAIRIDYAFLSSLIEKTPDWNEDPAPDLMYRKTIRSPLEEPESERISLAQLAFLSSGLIPPRQSDLLQFTKILLSDSKLTKSEVDSWHAYFTLAYAVAHREPGLPMSEDSEDEQAAFDEDKKNVEEELRALKAQNKKLRKLVNQLEHRNKECADELSRAKQQLRAAQTESAELRSMIRESVNTEEDSPVTVSFPYTSRKRAVIFGGHESWVKALRPLLNNVRFIAPSEQPHPGVLMNAEVVWIQTNALGHSGFYKAIDILRRNNIKVCYFSYAGAEKCAEQFALEDMETESGE